MRRYVFAECRGEIADLAHTIVAPRLFVKVCCSDLALRALLPDRWTLTAPSWVMVGPDRPGQIVLPAGYIGDVTTANGAIQVRIQCAGGLAASGYAVEAGGVFVYDRIITEPAHQRRGLGSAVMGLLGAQQRSAGSRPVLVATAAGRALYERLGWTVHAPYASAVIPEGAT